MTTALALLLLFSPQEAPDIVAAVNANVRAFREFIPDISCTEVVKSGEFSKDGKLVRPRTVESVFSPARINSGRIVFTPSRQVVAVDGKALKKGQTVPQTEIVQTTDYFFVPSIVFGQDNPSSRNFQRTGSESVEGVNAIVLEFTTKENQSSIRIVDPLRGTYALKDSGKAWLHPDTRQILKLEENNLNDPELDRHVTITFGEFVIDGAKRWLPRTVRYSALERKKTLGFIAEYSDCKLK